MIPLLLAVLVTAQSARISSLKERRDAERQEEVKPAAALKRLGEDLIPLYFHRRPWEAYERRYPMAEPLAFADYGNQAYIDWREELRTLELRIAAIEVSRLSREERVVLEAVTDWIRAESLLAIGRSPERWDAASYIRRVEDMLAALANTDYLPADSRLLRTMQVLEALEGYWGRARKSLVAPNSTWNTVAVGRLVDLGVTIERDLPRTFAGLRLKGRAKHRFERAVEEAVESTDAFRRWLLASRGHRTSKSGRMGVESWEVLMRAASGASLSMRELKTRLLREIATYNRRLGRHFEAERPSTGDLASNQIFSTVTSASATTVNLVRKSEVLALPAGKRPLGVLSTPGKSLPNRLCRLWPGAGAGYRLFIELPAATWSPGVKRTRETRLNPHAQAVLGMRYGWVGEALLRHAATVSPTPASRFLWNRSVLEGWGLYSLDWLLRIDIGDVDENPLGQNKRLQEEIIRTWRLEAIRLLASIELHCEELSIAEAAKSFQRRCATDLESAEAEVRAAHHDPLYGIGFLGYLELGELELAQRAEHSAHNALKETLSMVMRQPYLRPADHRRLLGSPPPR